MPPKGGNAKKESGRAKKAENEAKKNAAAEAEKARKEVDKWSEGAKSSKSKEEKEEKRRAELARKAEAARLLADEEAAIPPKVKTPKAGAKKAKPSKPAGPGAIAAGGGLEAVSVAEKEMESDGHREEPETFSATGIDNAIDLLEVVTAKMDKASVGQQAAGIERHPERRFKAAFEAYKELEMPNVRADHPGLRLQQYQDILYKQFQKSPENPFNQTTISYDATKEEKVDALKSKNAAIADRLREKS
ncbi:Coiled-coil domain-containing protein 124 homolog [Sparassis crispa]|uniref:Coiled-coil domain-containing protein 124 homolog n=1 Tax=Sparassis crispa TaxID=139825 RepID=A0A401GKY9_9APHY|nr:Coiled-coil domain-containing protein 124 homolog [Sparassis crispa]GBE82812.1 Coiled-coil domain-containing protein 124 homolog [Sparassis crispa]